MRNNNNKLFVKAMILTAIIGLTTLMITMFIGIKFFTEKNATPNKIKMQLPKEATQVEISSTILGVVRNINEASIQLFDTEKKQVITATIDKTTKVEDAYNGTMPLSMIKKGDVVEIVYEPQKDRLISISKTNRSWEKEDITNISIDTIGQKIKISQSEYIYGKDTLILNEKGEEANIQLIGEQDCLKIIGVDNLIWSIRVLEKQGKLIVGQLPTNRGTLEIDTNKILQLKDVAAPIYLSPGKHKIVLNMDGYEPISQQVDITSGSEVKVTAEGAKIAYTDVKMVVADGIVDYIVEVNGKTYKPEEKITLEKGDYTFKITAPGYKPWAMRLDVEGTTKTLQAVLTPETPVETSTPVPSPTAQPASYQVSISTDPAGADVYIGGVHKGITPYKMTLPVGDYKVELKKQGYATYTTSIIIDNSDNQNSYQYILTPIQ